jgi:hypothetical protein
MTNIFSIKKNKKIKVLQAALYYEKR